ncbi:hypothetical protein PtB15_3B175 [Puccinia triticina]|nr:hypothetical protein PtB15_3B175 [Puccinia triticina]
MRSHLFIFPLKLITASLVCPTWPQTLALLPSYEDENYSHIDHNLHLSLAPPKVYPADPEDSPTFPSIDPSFRWRPAPLNFAKNFMVDASGTSNSWAPINSGQEEAVTAVPSTTLSLGRNFLNNKWAADNHQSRLKTDQANAVTTNPPAAVQSHSPVFDMAGGEFPIDQPDISYHEKSMQSSNAVITCAPLRPSPGLALETSPDSFGVAGDIINNVSAGVDSPDSIPPNLQDEEIRSGLGEYQYKSPMSINNTVKDEYSISNPRFKIFSRVHPPNTDFYNSAGQGIRSNPKKRPLQSQEDINVVDPTSNLAAKASQSQLDAHQLLRIVFS